MNKMSKIEFFQDLKTKRFYAIGKNSKGEVVKYTKKSYKTQKAALKAL